MNTKREKIVVTGGAGFIGSHICDRLIREGKSVVCVDNLFSGKKEYIAHLLDNPLFQFIEHDIVQPLYFEEDFSHMFHLACPASPVAYQENPIKTIKTNVVGTINMLGLARAHDARVLFSSTSEVYGDPLEHPQTEKYHGNVNQLGRRACYDEGKRCAETLCMEYHREHGMDISIARIFNTYGPNMAVDDGRVVSNFIVQALNGEDVTVYGDGTQTRSFQYIDDLVEGLMLLMEKDGYVGPLNLGNPKEFTIRDLAERVIKETGSKSKIVTKPLPEDDPQRRRPDISRAQAELGWSPEVSLEEGLTRTIAYFKKVLT